MEEIINKQQSTKLILEAVNTIADTVGITYGPDGMTVALFDRQTNEPFTTKDGVSVVSHIKFKNPVKNMTATFIKEVANKTVEEAGDGTTTASLLASAFIKKGFELLENGYSYKEIKEDLETLLKNTSKYLIKNSKKVKKKDIYHVALISSNNDVQVANLVKDAFNHSNIVSTEMSTLVEDNIVKVNGMHIERSPLFNPAFINNANTNSSIYKEDVRVAVIDGTMDKIDPIKNILPKLGKTPLVIFADHFEDDILQILKYNYNKGAINVVPIKLPGVNEFRRNVAKDICIYTGSKLLSPNKTYLEGNFGKAEGIESNKDKTTIFNKDLNKSTVNRIKELEEYLSTDIDTYTKDITNIRIKQLNGSTAIIKVGGKSDIEIKERYDRIEDSVKAVTCALKEGIVEGGGVALAKASLQSVDNPFEECLLHPFKIINKNSEIVELDLGKSMFKENIIDPLKVTKCALENSISVAKTLLSTEAVVLNEYLWN